MDISWPESKIKELLEGAVVDVENDSIYSFANERADHAPHQALGSIIDGLAELVTRSSSSARLVDIVADLILNNECEQIANGPVSELIERVKISGKFLAREDRTAEILNIT